MVTPELRKASSRSRCSSVAKSNSVMVNVTFDGRNVTSVPRLSWAAPTTTSGATASPSWNSMKCCCAVAPDGELEPAGERIDHRDADAVQAAGNLVGVLVEFSAGMQLRHDDFGGGHAFTLVDVGRNAAAVVAHGAGTVRIEGDHDFLGKTGERFVDGVVDDLVDHVMEARAVIGVADIHARPLAHGVEALEHLDRFSVVIGGCDGLDLRAGSAIERLSNRLAKRRLSRLLCCTRKRRLVQGYLGTAKILSDCDFSRFRQRRKGSDSKLPEAKSAPESAIRP